MLASDWALPEETEISCHIQKGSSNTHNSQLKLFDFVFFIQLCHVNDNSPLEKIILEQHGLKNKDIPEEEIADILRGRTKEKVLLLLDGYDEYTKGTNNDIDAAIEDTIGDCFLILTSRDGDHINKETRNKMDGEIEIAGFDEQQVIKYAICYFGNKETATKMFQKAEFADVKGLLRLPIILLMVCILFDENEELPMSQTKIISQIVELLMDRSAIKHYGRKAKDIAGLEEMLYKLGELAWRALRKETRQLLLSSVSTHPYFLTKTPHWQLTSEGPFNQSIYGLNKFDCNYLSFFYFKCLHFWLILNGYWLVMVEFHLL